MTPSLNESARPDYAFWFSTLDIKSRSEDLH